MTRPRYLDASAPVADRVRDLLGRMTLAEKVGQVNQRLYGWHAYERTADGHRLTDAFAEELFRRVPHKAPLASAAGASISAEKAAQLANRADHRDAVRAARLNASYALVEDDEAMSASGASGSGSAASASSSAEAICVSWTLSTRF